MPVLAVRLAGVVSHEALSTQDVLSPRYRFEVVGVDTAPIAAQMIELKTSRDGTDDEFVCDTMR
jgi:hypothetical protein